MAPKDRHISPLRYPGGKGFISAYLQSVIDLNGLRGCAYYEPFAGGAGAGLRLLVDGVVSEVHLNDPDIRIASFWQAALNEAERFADAIMKIPLNLDEWHRQKQICTEADEDRLFDLGFATFYLNRCNRSGVLFGAAPIGGFEQTGTWTMDARFYRATLAERIRSLAERKEHIHITCHDALHFLREIAVPANQQNRIFAYLDPPYYMEGNRLYLNKYQDEDHTALAQEVKSAANLAWLTSYNNVPFIRDLYSYSVTTTLPVRYSMQKKQVAEELIIASPGITLPDSA